MGGWYGYIRHGPRKVVDTESKFYTLTQLGKLFGVHRRTVCWWVHRGYLKATRVNEKARWLVLKADYEAFCEGHPEHLARVTLPEPQK